MGGALGGWSKTPTEKALRICIQEAVKFIAAKTPQTYYHYQPGAPQVTAAAPAGVPPPPPTAPTPAGAAPAVPAAVSPSGPVVATAPPTDATGTPQALKVIQTIRADLDKELVADLNEVKIRGAIVSVVVTLRFVGNRKESEFLTVDKGKSGILNYDNGESAPVINLDGFLSGRMKPGEAKTLRATFKTPKGATKVGITLSGLGTFDDVVMAQ
jgi:hypothetical protein